MSETQKLAELLRSHERLTHRAHQLVGVEALVKRDDPDRGRVVPGVFALFDEVGAGKTKQCVDAANILYTLGDTDTVLVLTPGFARSTWAEEDPTLGEVSKHCWNSVPNIVHEFHGSYTDLDLREEGLHWIVTNYEFIRRDERRDQMLRQLRGRNVWMIVDESWCIKGRSDQTRACIMIRRKRASRATILNGTPLSDGKPMDLYYQFNFLDPDIIGVQNVTHFKSRYLVMGGFGGKTVVGHQHLDELNQRIAPYVLSRRTRDCFDLPPMLDPITISAPLSDPTWKLYREMRDDMVTWLGGQVSMSKIGITKILRLAQICSGFLGGLEDIDATDEDEAPLVTDEGTMPVKAPLPPWLAKAQGVQVPLPMGGPFDLDAPPVAMMKQIEKVTKEISHEKQSAYLQWLHAQPKLPHKLITWCRFKPELVRLNLELAKLYPRVESLRGGQKPEERQRVKRLLAPDGDPGMGAVTGICGTGAASLNFSAASVMVHLSHDPALIKRTQGIGRMERPGQMNPMLIVDVIATGPKGQKTYDHHVLKELRNKNDMASWTVNEWRRILAEE